MTDAEIIDFAARTSAAIEEPREEYLAACLMIDILRDNVCRLIQNMGQVRGKAEPGDRLRADFRHSVKHLQRAIDELNIATERLR